MALCHFCGYDLEGCAGSPRCPECGRPVVGDQQVFDHGAMESRKGRWIAAAVVVAFMAVVCLVCTGVLRF